MKRKFFLFLFVIQLIFILSSVSCNTDGNVILHNAYSHEVLVHSFYEFRGSTLVLVEIYRPGMYNSTDARGEVQYSNLVALRVLSPEGELLADYSRDHLNMLRGTQGAGKRNRETWSFSIRGLALRVS